MVLVCSIIIRSRRSLWVVVVRATAIVRSVQSQTCGVCVYMARVVRHVENAVRDTTNASGNHELEETNSLVKVSFRMFMESRRVGAWHLFCF